jgi:hypothetical protein
MTCGQSFLRGSSSSASVLTLDGSARQNVRSEHLNFLDEAGVELAPWVCYLEKPLPTGFEPAQEEWKSFQDLQICFQSLDE